MLHIRDEALLFFPDIRPQAERELRTIAIETGLYAVVVTVPQGRDADPPRVFSPIMAEIERRGGAGYILLVEAGQPDSGSSAYSPELNAVWEVMPQRQPAADPGPRVLSGPPFSDGALVQWLREVRVVALEYAIRR